MRTGMRFVGFVLACAVLLSSAGGQAQGLTGDEILARSDVSGEILGLGDFRVTLSFESRYQDGTAVANRFLGVSHREEGGREALLLYFLEPEDVLGTIFLSRTEPGEDARLWLYLPALDLPKELVSGSERGGSFAGSSFSFEEIGARSLASDFAAELIGDETVDVGGTPRGAHVLLLTARPGADVEHPAATLWVDKETWITLRAESRRSDGSLASTMRVLALGEFEGDTVITGLESADLEEGVTTTISFLDERRPGAPLSLDLFAPEALASFDPVAAGLLP